VNNVEGLRNGALHWYDREENHLEVMHFQKGKRHGINKIFYSDGTLRIEVNYINDKKEGPEKYYFSTGKLASEVTFINGQKEGLQKEYNEDGTLNNDVMYKHGYKEGEKRWYDKNGKIIKTETYKMDRPINVMKKVQAKKPDATIEALKGLDFNPNNRQVD
jgi:antitoxin component YwqK of YwqJK toxin-antitoxin module